MIEYTCQDCGHRVISYVFSSPAEAALCASCHWVRSHIPPQHQADARERLGVPLAAGEAR
jgi:hypothetical protein